MPAVLRFPPLVPAGTVGDEVLTAMDVLPTLAGLAGAPLPEGRELDGEDVRALWSGERGPERSYLYYGRRGDLSGIRQGRWKLALPGGALHDLDADPGEERDVAGSNAELATDLRRTAKVLDDAIEEAKRPVRVVSEQLFDPKGP